MDLLNETVLLKTKSTLFNLLIWETSQFLCYERLLNMTLVAYKMHFSTKCNSGRNAIQWFHIKHYLDYWYEAYYNGPLPSLFKFCSMTIVSAIVFKPSSRGTKVEKMLTLAQSRQKVYKIPAVYLSGAKNVCFCMIGDFVSPTIGIFT